MAAVFNSAVQDEYLALVRTFPLLSIKDDAHLADALRVLDHLVEKTERSEAEEQYRGALTDLVETYEQAHVVMPPTSGIEALRYLMAENGLTEGDLGALFPSPSALADTLAGERQLTLTDIQRLAGYFGVPADVFIERG